MSEMNKTYFGEGLIDVMDAREVVTDEQIIKVSRSSGSENTARTAKQLIEWYRTSTRKRPR